MTTAKPAPAAYDASPPAETGWAVFSLRDGGHVCGPFPDRETAEAERDRLAGQAASYRDDAGAIRPPEPGEYDHGAPLDPTGYEVREHPIVETAWDDRLRYALDFAAHRGDDHPELTGKAETDAKAISKALAKFPSWQAVDDDLALGITASSDVDRAALKQALKAAR